MLNFTEKSTKNHCSARFQGCPLSCPQLYFTCFLPFALYESGTRKALLGPSINNTEVYLAPLLIFKITQLQDKTEILLKIELNSNFGVWPCDPLEIKNKPNTKL